MRIGGNRISLAEQQCVADRYVLRFEDGVFGMSPDAGATRQERGQSLDRPRGTQAGEHSADGACASVREIVNGHAEVEFPRLQVKPY